PAACRGELREVGDYRRRAARRSDRVPRRDSGLPEGSVSDEAPMREVEGLVLTQRERIEGVAAVARDQLGSPNVVLRAVTVAALRRPQKRAQEQPGGDHRQREEHVER